VFHGEPDEDNADVPDLTWREGLVMAPLLGLIVFLGVYPKPFLDRVEPAVERLVTHVEDHSDYVEPEVAGTHDDDDADAGADGAAEEGGH
jgi:NADH-quinone oxidoreductase subunit M